MARLGSLTQEKIILKVSLKHVPIFGELTSINLGTVYSVNTIETLYSTVFTIRSTRRPLL